MLKQPWLEIAEYASLAGSALGIIAAATSSQVICAAAPLTLALSLNLVNRKQSHQQTRQHIISAIADVHQAFNPYISNIRHFPLSYFFHNLASLGDAEEGDRELLSPSVS